jgi:type VI secretion system protein ImpM
MRCGLYGKLPPKRDFIALFAPRAFLGVWEPWMQAAVSASRQSLSNGWQQAFLTAPIWRFWLGADVCGTATLGAFMPSLDGIGRYFPLTLFACSDAEASLPPPELNAQDAWFNAAEDLLLSTLEEDATFEAATAGLDTLPPPSDRIERALPEIPMTRAQAMLAMPSGERPFPELFEAMRNVDHAGIYAAATFWWTIGGEGYAPLALGGKGMPDPFVFADMLTGRLVTESVFAPGGG